MGRSLYIFIIFTISLCAMQREHSKKPEKKIEFCRNVNNSKLPIQTKVNVISKAAHHIDDEHHYQEVQCMLQALERKLKDQKQERKEEEQEFTDNPEVHLHETLNARKFYFNPKKFSNQFVEVPAEINTLIAKYLGKNHPIFIVIACAKRLNQKKLTLSIPGKIRFLKPSYDEKKLVILIQHQQENNIKINVVLWDSEKKCITKIIYTCTEKKKSKADEIVIQIAQSILFSPNNLIVGLISKDNWYHFFDTEGTLLRRINLSQYIKLNGSSIVSYCLNNNFFAISNALTNRIGLYSVNDGSLIKEWFFSNCRYLQFIDNTRLIGYFHNTHALTMGIMLLQAHQQPVVKTYEGYNWYLILSEGRVLLGKNKNCDLLNTLTNKIVREFPIDGVTKFFLVSSNEKVLAIAGTKREKHRTYCEITLHDIKTGECRGKIELGNISKKNIALSHCGSKLAILKDQDCQLEIWDLDNKKKIACVSYKKENEGLASLVCHDVVSLAFSQDNQYVIFTLREYAPLLERTKSGFVCYFHRIGTGKLFRRWFEMEHPKNTSRILNNAFHILNKTYCLKNKIIVCGPNTYMFDLEAVEKEIKRSHYSIEQALFLMNCLHQSKKQGHPWESDYWERLVKSFDEDTRRAITNLNLVKLPKGKGKSVQ